jgi:rhodanese-related sulfurtransferase
MNDCTDPNVRTITVEELRHKMGTRAVVLLDARSTEEYRGGHLPGAMSLPWRLAGELAPVYVPDPAAEIVAYGAAGESSGASNAGQHLAERLQCLGYTSVRLYAGDAAEWTRVRTVRTLAASAGGRPAQTRPGPILRESLRAVGARRAGCPRPRTGTLRRERTSVAKPRSEQIPFR